MNTNVKYTYLRDANRKPIACIAAIRTVESDGSVIAYVGVSSCNKKDAFNPTIARNIASVRATSLKKADTTAGKSIHQNWTRFVVTSYKSGGSHYMNTVLENFAEDHGFGINPPRHIRKAAARKLAETSSKKSSSDWAVDVVEAIANVWGIDTAPSAMQNAKFEKAVKAVKNLQARAQSDKIASLLGLGILKS
jgi:hypothetical protein